MAASNKQLIIGLDVGSTTVKAVVMDKETQEVLWKDYQRHETKQPEKCLEFFDIIEKEFPNLKDNVQVFMTGSGAGTVAPLINAKFVQEVNAVSLAVEKYHPDTGSVVELGGQDAKIIIWQEDPNSDDKRKLPTMNDKCAGGTGAVIDKIGSKLQITTEELLAVNYKGTKLHPVAGKCGVFAETDINGLQKQGVNSNELIASLFEAIVQQNLSVLTRGNTLLPKVLLLGGPNTFIPAMQDAWKHNIPKIWAERDTDLGDCENPEDLIFVPENAEYFAAIGAVLYGNEEPEGTGVFNGTEKLNEYINGGRTSGLAEGSSDLGLIEEGEDLNDFKTEYAVSNPEYAKFKKGEVVKAWLGIDGGSTSTKGVLVDKDKNLIAEAYGLSKGNPIPDTIEMLKNLQETVEKDGAILDIQGVGTTGYAKDMLKETFGADAALVETVAHAEAALHYYKDTDVLVDVGGQDIKVIFIKNGMVSDFKLNTQCSAGNGYFLQNTADKFGVKIQDFADTAFEADITPVFSYGCAVFMESDIVNFQRLGWQAKEIMAGLAKVLPKNIWLYVVQEPNLAKFGLNFVLQGGTQKNLAAVKSQVDYIKERVPGSKVTVHQYCGVSGAIGAAFEAINVTKNKKTSFVGLEQAKLLTFTATRDESTRCDFCSNNCLRTFIDSKTVDGNESRFIVATCEKGEVTDREEMKVIVARQKEKAKSNPNLVSYSAKRVFRTFRPELIAKADSKLFGKANIEKVLQDRKKLTIGMPRALNMYTFAPFFRSYFEALGVKKIIWSAFTEPEMYKAGSKRGSIDPCFPSKVAISHIHDLINNEKHKIDILYYPVLINIKDDLVGTTGSCACPTVQSNPNVCKAAFTKETDEFGNRNIKYIDNSLNMLEPNFLVKQMFESFEEELWLGKEENKLAVEAGLKAMEEYYTEIKTIARSALNKLVATNKIGMLMIGRPYHNDPGLNHEIMDLIQQEGYPVFSMESLPDNEQELEALFGEEVRAGKFSHPKDISDVYSNAYSANTNLKMWAAKYAARHPNLAVIDLSNFKCGMDAPIYNVVEGIVEGTNTPYFTFHDIDENKPTGSIKIRVETICYALKKYESELVERTHIKIEPKKETEKVLEPVLV
jgi:predicted CoA-substrate-specific enzyme activase